jgi:hypothetical protein
MTPNEPSKVKGFNLTRKSHVPTESIDPANTICSGVSDESESDIEMESTTQVGLGGDHAIPGTHLYEYRLLS